MGLFSTITKFKNQDYDKLKKKCRGAGELFTDPEFPAAARSINPSGPPPARVVWKRPHEICEKPRLFVDGVGTGDVTQGQLGNCWFVAACMVLAGVKVLWNKVIPDYDDQEYSDKDPKRHAGIFHCRFWRFGEWVDVVIDDRLPTVDGHVIYTHSRERSEFWSALLEKAYAKINTSYQSLEGGSVCDALVDLTSGVSATIELVDGGYRSDDTKKTQLFKELRREKADYALMCAAVAARNKAEVEQKTVRGLVKGHAYGITAIKKIPIGDTKLVNLFQGREKICMVRLRNPWGVKEWTGAFSDKSPEWNKISESEKEKIGLTFEEDGEFWMTFDDFVANFTEVSVCQLINTSFFSFSKTWKEVCKFGSWTRGIRGRALDRAGGCPNNKATFLHNPQYLFDVEEEEDEVVVQLSQKDQREKKHIGVHNLCIGFHIMKVEVNRKYRVHQIQEKAATSDYMQSRSIFWRDKLSRGRYVLVPTTLTPGKSGEFMLRFFMGSSPQFRELVKEQPNPSRWSCIPSPNGVVQVTVVSAAGLEKQDSLGSANQYVIIQCGNTTVRSTPAQESTENDHVVFTWNYKAIFYHIGRAPIKIQIWNSCPLKDKFMGQATLEAESSPWKVLSLFGKTRAEATKQMPGMLCVKVKADSEMAAI